MVSASMAVASSALTTRIGVTACNTDVRLLACLGDKCTTTTNAMPLPAGMFRKNWGRASRPPADAPRPTTWNFRLLRRRSDSDNGRTGVSALMGSFCAASGPPPRTREHRLLHPREIERYPREPQPPPQHGLSC